MPELISRRFELQKRFRNTNLLRHTSARLTPNIRRALIDQIRIANYGYYHVIVNFRARISSVVETRM